MDEPAEQRSGMRAPRRAEPRSGAEERADWFGLDAEAARAIVAREPRALERLFDAAFDPLYGFARRMLRDDASAEDLTQEVFVKLLRALPTYRPERPLRPWAFAIASNALRDHFAARARRESSQGSTLDEDPAGEAVDPHPSPSAQIEGLELTERIEVAVSRLSPLLRSALVLRHVQGLPFEEVAGILATSEEAVRQRCSRALRELRRMLTFTQESEERA